MSIRTVDVLVWKFGHCFDSESDKITIWRHPTLPQPSEVEIEALRQEFILVKASTLYRQKRAQEYPPVQDGLDALVKKELGDLKAWQDYVAACDAVKKKYPKPEKTL